MSSPPFYLSNSLFHSFILKTWDNLDFLKRKLSMLFVLVHRIIFHDKNLMDEEILKTASNASSQATSNDGIIIKVFFLLYLENQKNVFL